MCNFAIRLVGINLLYPIYSYVHYVIKKKHCCFMMKKNTSLPNTFLWFFILICHLLLFTACPSSKKTQTKAKLSGKNDGKIEVVLLQMNDVYEITPLENGKVGGMARVAQLRNQLKQKNKNTFTILAGDFLSPSVLGTVKNEGKRIAGAQMVDVMNTMGVDLVVFGNHEFDIKEADLQSRLNESKFVWVASNVKHVPSGKDPQQPFAKIDENGKATPLPEVYVIEAADADGTTLRIGVIGVTLPANKANYVHYDDAFVKAREMYKRLAKQTDFVIGITHQSIEEDMQIAAQIPEVKLWLGGHEHQNMLHKVGTASIAKADANAKTVYIHTLSYNRTNKTLQVRSNLQSITDKLSDDPATAAVVNKWVQIGEANFASQGFKTDEVVAVIPENAPLEGREAYVRIQPTNLASIIANAFLKAYPTADAALLNTGSIRIDDQLVGKITQYDILRVLPFGGGISEIEMKGSLLIKLLDTGEINKGSGGYLQYAQIEKQQNTWLIKKQPVSETATYKIVVPDFLLTGGEKNMDWFTEKNPEIIKINKANTDITNDTRKVVITYW